MLDGRSRMARHAERAKVANRKLAVAVLATWVLLFVQEEEVAFPAAMTCSMWWHASRLDAAQRQAARRCVTFLCRHRIASPPTACCYAFQGDVDGLRSLKSKTSSSLSDTAATGVDLIAGVRLLRHAMCDFWRSH